MTEEQANELLTVSQSVYDIAQKSMIVANDVLYMVGLFVGLLVGQIFWSVTKDAY